MLKNKIAVELKIIKEIIPKINVIVLVLSSSMP